MPRAHWLVPALPPSFLGSPYSSPGATLSLLSLQGQRLHTVSCLPPAIPVPDCGALATPSRCSLWPLERGLGRRSPRGPCSLPRSSCTKSALPVLATLQAAWTRRLVHPSFQDRAGAGNDPAPVNMKIAQGGPLWCSPSVVVSWSALGGSAAHPAPPSASAAIPATLEPWSNQCVPHC